MLVVFRRSSGQSCYSYSETLSGRHRRCRKASATAGMLLLAFASGACSFSYQLDNLYSAQGEGTGSIKPQPRARTAELPPENDLALARAHTAPCE